MNDMRDFWNKAYIKYKVNLYMEKKYDTDTLIKADKVHTEYHDMELVQNLIDAYINS